MGKGQELYKKAKRLIPGGTMLLSKRPEMFLPDQWPSYFSKAKGCKVWDLDGKEYTDVSIMGIGTNTLGYGHEEVDDAVFRVVRDGNMSTFCCPEEDYKGCRNKADDCRCIRYIRHSSHSYNFSA